LTLNDALCFDLNLEGIDRMMDRMATPASPATLAKPALTLNKGHSKKFSFVASDLKSLKKTYLSFLQKKYFDEKI
jgi:hypothetical protein